MSAHGVSFQVNVILNLNLIIHILVKPDVLCLDKYYVCLIKNFTPFYNFYGNNSKPNPEDSTNVNIRSNSRPAGKDKQLLGQKIW